MADIAMDAGAEAPKEQPAPEAPKVEKRYRVLEFKNEEGNVVPLTLTNKIGGAKGKPFNWDAGSEIGSGQVSEEEAATLIEEKKIELIV